MGLLCPIGTVEPQGPGPWTPNHGDCALGLGGFSVSVVDSFYGGFVWTPSLLTHQFQAKPCRRYRQVVSIIGRIDLGCTSNPLLGLIFMTAPASVFMILLGKNFVANLDAANILPDLGFGAERSNVCFSTSLHIGGQRA